MSNTRAADLGGVTGLYIPDHATEFIINDICETSILGEISNPKFDFNGLGLNAPPRSVHYHIVEDVDLSIPTRHNLNGESIHIPSPFRNGTIEMCHEIVIENKYSRDEAIRLGDWWEVNQNAVEEMLGRNLSKTVEQAALMNVASLIRPENQGNNAGLSGGKIYLGDSNKPLNVVARKDEQVTDFNVTATEVVRRLALAFSLGKSAAPQNRLRVVASPYFLSILRAEQANAMRGGSCCIEGKPEISGILSNSWGFPILECHNMPVHYMADGTMIDYVMLINPEMVAVPMNLDYLEWQPLLRDIYLSGVFRYGSHLMSGKAATMAAVKYSA